LPCAPSPDITATVPRSAQTKRLARTTRGHHSPAAEVPPFGSHIRALRLGRGLSQAELGGPYFTRAHVSAIELGKILPSIRALAHFGTRLHLALRELVPTGDVATDSRHYEAFTPVFGGQPNEWGHYEWIDVDASNKKWHAGGRTGRWEPGMK
jgi:transcriptional regulator with XRE-family HTH domain